MRPNPSSHLRRLIHTALFAALCCVATCLIILPLPYGYVNAGDIFVLLGAFCLGPVSGAIAAGMGCAFADLFSGYALYIPATLLVKGCVAAAAVGLYHLLRRAIPAPHFRAVCRAIACVGAEAVMVAGYFAYESLLYGVGGALLSISGNLLQGVTCAAAALFLSEAMAAIRPARREFPALER